MTPALRVLLVDGGDGGDREVVDALRRAGFQPVHHRRVGGRTDEAAALAQQSWDAVIYDTSTEGLDVTQALEVLHSSGQDLPFIVLSEPMEEEAALAIVRAGAHDILRRDRLRQLGPALEGHLRDARVRRDKRLWEQALKISEQRYRSLFERNLAGVYRATLGGRLLECNESFARIFGYASPAEAIATAAADYYAEPEQRREFLETLERRGEVRSFEKEYRTSSGAPIWVLENATLVRGGNGGGEPYIEGTVIDITERRNAEAQLLQAQKMEAVGRLAGGVAHDFNNLLQAMLGAIQLGRMRRERGADDEDVLGELKDLVSRGAQLARQLLLFSRRDRPNVVPLDLGEVVKGMQKLLTRLLRENIRIEVKAADRPLPITGDRSQLEQVLINLAVNAADAMPDGGRLTLATGGGDEHAWLEVADTGHGIPDEVREQMFEPFFTTKDRHAGTGLGLSVVHGIVTAHDGSIEVDTELGRGTTFRVLLPLAAPATETVAESRVDPDLPRGSGERILLAEDEPDTRRWLAEDLVGLGYDVTTVASAEEAEEHLENEAFDVLLSDCVLTGAGGPELARRLRSRWPDLEVIFMSGYAEDQVIEQALATTGARFLQKPFFIEDLAAELRKVLGGVGE